MKTEIYTPAHFGAGVLHDAIVYMDVCHFKGDTVRIYSKKDFNYCKTDALRWLSDFVAKGEFPSYLEKETYDERIKNWTMDIEEVYSKDIEQELIQKLTKEHKNIYEKFLSDNTHQLAYGTMGGLVFVSKKEFLHDYDETLPYAVYDVNGQLLTDHHTKAFSYLISLNPICGSDKVWLPEIGEKDLKRLRENDNPVVITHDWFSQGSYEYGAWTLQDEKFMELQKHNEAKIVNAGGEFIFECGTMDHKGLIAIEIPRTLPFFVMERSWDQEAMKELIRVWFEPNVNQKFKNNVVSMLKTYPDAILEIKEDWLTIYAEDYDRMLEQLPVELI